MSGRYRRKGHAANHQIRQELGLTDEHWTARSSVHTLEEGASTAQGPAGGLYELFKQGLFVDHSKVRLYPHNPSPTPRPVARW